MPTGYTAALADRKFNVRDWLLNDLIRGMDVCGTLRDEKALTIDEIRMCLATDIAEAEKIFVEADKERETLSRLAARSRDEWKKEHEMMLANATKANAERAKKHHAAWDAHEKALLELKAALVKARSEVGIGTLTFAVDQLRETISHDFRGGPYQNNLTTDLDAYIKEALDNATENLRDTLSSYQTEIALTNGRLNSLDAFVAEVDRLFPAEVPA